MIPPSPGEVSVVYARHEFAYRYAMQFVGGNDVIDVGCGTGYGCKLLASAASSVLGVDHDESAIFYAQENYDAPNVKYRVLNAEVLDIDQTFDVVVCFQVIEHMRDAGAFLDRLKEITRPGGRIIVSTPNVKTRHAEGAGNPFHFSEMNHAEFHDLLDQKFSRFYLLGIGYKSRSLLRELLQKLPFYSVIGRMLRRESAIKKAVARSLRLTDYDIIDRHVGRDALDLLAVCRVDV